MILSLIVIVLLALIAFFHYTQGLFAATVSAFCAGVAAFMAFSYHESIPATWLAAPMGAYGYPVILVILFALIYIVLRTLIDNLLPGNVRFPGLLDKIGAAVMGLIAALFPAAIVALAAQEMPVGPSFMMYSTYETEDGAVAVDRDLSRLYQIEQGDDAPVYDAMVANSFVGEEAAETRQSLLLPVDEWFLGMVENLSDQGSLAGKRTLSSVYPDFKQAFYGERIGVQPTASRTALNIADDEQVTVPAMFLVDTEAENAQFAGGIRQVEGDLRVDGDSVSDRLEPESSQAILVMRVLFDSDAQDEGYVRFSPGSMRLVVGGEQYFPIGTLESATVLIANTPDDYLHAEQGADLVFLVDREVALEGETLADDAFLQVKRYARVDLGDTPLGSRVDKTSQTHLLRKVMLRRAIGEAVAGETGINDQMDAFQALRADVADESEQAPPAASTQDGTEGDAGEADPDNPMEVIREGASDRNTEIEGDGDGDN